MFDWLKGLFKKNKADVVKETETKKVKETKVEAKVEPKTKRTYTRKPKEIKVEVLVEPVETKSETKSEDIKEVETKKIPKVTQRTVKSIEDIEKVSKKAAEAFEKIQEACKEVEIRQEEDKEEDIKEIVLETPKKRGRPPKVNKPVDVVAEKLVEDSHRGLADPEEVKKHVQDVNKEDGVDFDSMTKVELITWLKGKGIEKVTGKNKGQLVEIAKGV